MSKLNIQDLEQLWDNYISSRVTDVEDMSKLVFHAVVGCWLNKTNIYSPGNTITPRTSVFMVSPTRTGKGILLMSGNTICKDLDLVSDYVSGSVTPKTLVGGLSKSYNKLGEITKEIEIPGYMKTHDYIAWGEAKSILTKSEEYGSMKDVLLSALDEPGKVTSQSYSNMYEKDPMKKGQLYGYNTNATILTGSMWIKNLTTELATSGLLQRFLISFTKRDKNDYKSFRKKIDEMKVDTIKKIEDETKDDEFTPRKKYLEILLKDRIKLVNAIKEIPRQHYLKIRSADLQDFLRERGTFFEEAEKDFPSSGPKLEAIQGFFTASYDHTFKLAGQKCAVEGRNTITYDDLMYGFEVVKKSIRASMQVLNIGVVEPTTEADAARTRTVLNIVRHENGRGKSVTQSTLLERLREEQHKGNWDLGKPSTKEFIIHLVEKKLLLEIRGNAHNKIFYYTKNDYISPRG